MKNILFLALLLTSNYLFSQSVGINTNNPTATVDINGDLRIRSIAPGMINDSILSVDANGLVHKIKFNVIYSTSYKLYSENYDSLTFIGNNTSGLNSYSIGMDNNSSGDANYNLGINNTTLGVFNSSFGNGNIISGGICNSYGNSNVIKGNQSYVYGSYNLIDTLVSNGYVFGKEDTLRHESSYLFGIGLISHTNEEYVFGRYNTKYTPTLTINDRAYTFAYGSNANPKNYLTILKNGIVGIGQDSLETTNSSAKLQVKGEISSELRSYANHAAASTDLTLKTGTFYLLGTTSPQVYIKR